MAMKPHRLLPALLVLGVLFASQAAYAADASPRPNGHCAEPAPAEQSCPLPLWLTCCDELPAVSSAAAPIQPNGVLALPCEAAALPARFAARLWVVARAEIPPDTPLSRTGILQI